jgi:hypothetical protein
MSAAGQIRDIVSAALDEFLQALHGRDDKQQKQIDDLTRRVEALENPRTAARRGGAVKAQAGTATAKGEAPGATTA